MRLARQSENYLPGTAIQKSATVDTRSPPSVKKSGLAPGAGTAKAAKPEPLEAAPPESQSVPAETLGQYRLDVARAARQFKSYPSLARENGWEGSVIVELSLAAGQGNPVVSLGRSSGYDALNRLALEMIERAARLAVLPPGLRGRSLTLSLPVEYLRTD